MKTALFAFLFALTLGLLVFAEPKPTPAPLVIAHRGANAQAPENALPAFKKALALGAPGLETDLFVTKDGHVVLSHDATIDRCSDGTGRIANLTLDELRQQDFGSWFSAAFAGTQIPTLEEFLDTAAEAPLLLLEFKTADNDIAAKTIAQVKAKGLMDKTVFQSFDTAALRACKAADPAAKTALLYTFGSQYAFEAARNPAAFCEKQGLDALHPTAGLVTASLVRRAQKAGIPVRAWTFGKNTKKAIAAAHAQGVQGFITDAPTFTAELLAQPKWRHWLSTWFANPLALL